MALTKVKSGVINVDILKAINSATSLGATPAVGDLFVIYDVSADAEKKITLQELLDGVSVLTEDTTPDDAADYLMTYDNSASTAKKVLVGNITPFTKSFVSEEQTITSAGSLSIAHGLGEVPKLIQVRLKCLTTDLNYAVDEEVIVAVADHTSSRGIAIVPGSVNLDCRFGNAANVFLLLNRSTGSNSAITNSRWSIIIYAWA